MNKVTMKTQELLDACKEAGYKFVAICVADKRVPDSIKRRDKSYETRSHFYYNADKPYNINSREQCGIVSAAPQDDDLDAQYPPNVKANRCGRPRIWAIVKKLGLTAGFIRGGYGCGETHQIHPVHITDLTQGCYEL